ncbi:hypothetical protein J6590_011685 [Homalodisca vitripennis]|nr:hypothetical protein J6590_011685 [Homalodisca vitripennis]
MPCAIGMWASPILASSFILLHQLPTCSSVWRLTLTECDQLFLGLVLSSIERIRALLLEPISEGNEPLADDSDNGGDHEEDTSDHNTETEGSADEDDERPEPAREENEMGNTRKSPRQLKLKVKELAGIRDEPRRRAETAPGRCAYCSWRQNRKTKVTCSSCYRYICKEHTTNFCTNCSEDADDEVEEEA